MIKISMMSKKDIGNLKAFFSVDLGTKLVIRDCKLVEGSNGLFVAMPSRQYDDKDGNKKWTNIVQILDKNLLNEIQEAALKEYGYSPTTGLEQEQENSDFPF